MPQELVALVGGHFDGKCFMNEGGEDAKWIKYKVRDIDQHSYMTAVYERGGVGQDGIQEYRYTEDFIMFHESLAAAGEDIWFLQQFPDDFKGFAADIGASDGITINNTILLERKGWGVLCVEPQPGYDFPLSIHRKLVERCACGSVNLVDQEFQVHSNQPASFSALKPVVDDPSLWVPQPHDTWQTIRVPVRRLDELLEHHKFPRLDALSIDVEGAELDVLGGLDLERWKPKAVIVESWKHIGPVVPYMHERGYRLVERRDPNDLFLRNE